MLLFLIVAVCASVAQGQQHRYTVHRGGKQIGEITTSRTSSPNTQTYTVLSDVSFKVLWKNYHRKTSNLVVYEHEKVKISHSEVYMNNDLQDSTSLKQDRNGYQCYRYPDEQFLMDEPNLRFTTVRLYFQEPRDVDQVYSERFLQYCALEAQGGHKYKLALPNGKTNYYTYVDQVLTKVLIDRTWFDLEFRKSN